VDNTSGQFRYFKPIGLAVVSPAWSVAEGWVRASPLDLKPIGLTLFPNIVFIKFDAVFSEEFSQFVLEDHPDVLLVY